MSRTQRIRLGLAWVAGVALYPVGLSVDAAKEGAPTSATVWADTLNQAPPIAVSIPSCNDSFLAAVRMPKRNPRAMTGTEFATHTKGWNGRTRQEAALQELRNGNIPDFLRRLHAVHLQHKTRNGRLVRATIWVTPDYLSIGSDADFLRIPLTRPSAVLIAKDLGFVLPTRKIVDAIHTQADFQCTPRPLPPGRKMRSSEFYVRHNQLIQDELQGREQGELVSGQKKDVVLTGRLLAQERIAIYGWHKKDGKPIQGLSTVHEARYADYSHGIRLVYATVCIDGQPRSIYDVFEDPELGAVLSYEGSIKRFRRLMSWHP